MATEKPSVPKNPDEGEPFISKEDRPDLTIDLNKKAGELTVRDLKTLLGGGGSTSVIKQVIEKPLIFDKIPHKEPKEIKDVKDHKEPKDHADEKIQKDQKDHKEPKDHKDTKDTKDHKDTKDQADTKAQKDHKDPKEHKDEKDHKDPKEAKDHKELVDNKGRSLLEKTPIKDSLEKLPEIVKEPGEASSPPVPTTGLEELIQRLTGLEREVNDLKSKGPGPSK